ncbi:Glutathione synthetase [Halotydeus destructor]|nr:Glutathione synthetase [Halotydeus destructor]
MDQILPNADIFSQVTVRDFEMEVKDFAVCNGLCVRLESSQSSSHAEVLATTAFASPFPRSCFKASKEVQKSVNVLMNKVAFDDQFLETSLRSTIQVDEFTKKLFDIHCRVLRTGSSQPNCFGLLRADYMVDVSKEHYGVKQVEVNSIASSFAGLASKVTKLHRHVISKYCPKYAEQLPENKVDINYAMAFIEAWKTYGMSSAAILFVVEERTLNICDQRSLEFQINTLRPDIKTVRRSFNELLEVAALGSNQQLIIESKVEVAVVYFRHGYDPSHYAGEAHWDLRYMLEKSKALKCPSINYQLAGAKKVQQVLTKQEILEKFLDEKAVKEVMNTFTGMYGFELGEEGEKTVELALSEPERFVMKPQREGGGHNVYGKDIPGELNPMRSDKRREAYVLMDLIRPLVVKNIILSSKSPIDYDSPFKDTVSELGIFGAIIANSQEILLNEQSGHLLRSKFEGINEGGIVAGFGAIDSPLLF